MSRRIFVWIFGCSATILSATAVFLWNFAADLSRNSNDPDRAAGNYVVLNFALLFLALICSICAVIFQLVSESET